MPIVRLIMAIAFPLLMAAGGLMAWRQSRRGEDPAESQSWRDDSLDDWRRDREATIEAQRQARHDGNPRD